MIKNKLMRVHINFDREMLDIVNKRINNGSEKNIRKPKATSPRLTLAVVRHKLFKTIKKDIIDSELKDERFLN